MRVNMSTELVYQGIDDNRNCIYIVWMNMTTEMVCEGKNEDRKFNEGDEDDRNGL